MKVLLSLIIIFVLSSCSQLSDEEIFVQIMDDEWSRLTKNNPVYASSMGILDRNQEWSDYSVSAELEDNEHNVAVLNKLLTLDYKSFSDLNKTNYALFVKEYENDIEEHSFGTFYMPFSHRGGIQLLHETTSVLPFRTTEHYYDWISRLQKIPIVIDQIIEKASIGIEKNIVPPFVLMNRVYEQIKLQANVSSVNSPFNKHFIEIDTSRFDTDEIVLIQSKALETIDELVIPAYQKLLIFFENEYLPNIRKTIGIKDIPDGKKYYEFIARKFTTTDLTPLEIHNIGLQEVKRIRSEMQSVIDSLNWSGTFDEFLTDLRTNPKFYFDNPEDLFTEYLATSKRIDPELVNQFKYLPRMPYGLKPIPIESAPDTTTAYYQRPAADGSRAGYYYVNLYRPEVRPKYEIEVLSVHEAMPGHHLQIALAMELDLPNFRKYGGFTAFIEGWGLYSESLGYDLGLYKDPYSKFGQLTYDMWRAIRLVVDTGMHYMDWTRQDAINYFLENSAKTKQDIINEVDRYINWPGQALAYKIGQLKILELKNTSKLKLGDDYDVREFHHQILKNGALPLYMVEQNINNWISSY